MCSRGKRREGQGQGDLAIKERRWGSCHNSIQTGFTIKGRWTFAIFTQHQRDQEREGSKEEERREIKENEEKK